MTTILLLVCCSCLTASPFPASFSMTAPHIFTFIADGNADYPSNTRDGEAGRIAWLDHYIKDHHLCPLGYDITERIFEHPVLTPQHCVGGERYWQIKYRGQCKATAS